MRIKRDKDGSWDVEISEDELEKLPQDLFEDFVDGFREYKPGVFTGEDSEVIRQLKEKPEKPKRVRKKKTESVAGNILKELHRITGIPKAMVARDLRMKRTGYLQHLRSDMRFLTWLKVVDDLGYCVKIEKGDGDVIMIDGKEMKWREDDT